MIIKSYGTLLRNYSSVEAESKNFIVGAVPQRQMDEINLPVNFNGRVVWKDFLSPIKSSGNCGMCYATSTVSCLSDRYAILTHNQIHEEFSAADMVICLTADPKLVAEKIFNNKEQEFKASEKKAHELYACKGNSLYNAGKYLFIEGATTERCVPDILVSEPEGSVSIPMCENTEGGDFDTCIDGITASRFYRASKAYQLNYQENDLEGTEKQIMFDIYKWGPLAMGFIMNEDFLKWDGKGIFKGKPEDVTVPAKNDTLGHAVRVIGWGEEDGVKYWQCANCWGTNWGEDGFFKIQKFIEGFDMEKNTLCLIPDLPGIPNLDMFSSEEYIDEADRTSRRALGVSLYNLYPYTAIDKIHNGFLEGDLSPIIDIKKLPQNYSKFFAAVNATPEYEIPKWIWALVLVIITAVVTYFVTKRLIK